MAPALGIRPWQLERYTYRELHDRAIYRIRREGERRDELAWVAAHIMAMQAACVSSNPPKVHDLMVNMLGREPGVYLEGDEQKVAKRAEAQELTPEQGVAIAQAITLMLGGEDKRPQALAAKTEPIEPTNG